MRTGFRRMVAGVCGVLLAPAWLAAQEPATITGRVTSEAGVALADASVFIEGLNLGALTRDDGRYTILVPAARVQGQQVTLTARLLGFRSQSVPVTLTGGTIARDFVLALNPLRLGEVVVTGAGTVTTREKLGTVINTVDSTLITRSNETNVVAALAGKAPNVEVRSQTGEPGGSASIRIRGSKSILTTGQPLFVVDGVPIDNSTYSIEGINPNLAGLTAGTIAPNRASDINPADIESVEVLKGAAAAAIYGARAADGVILITTKSGRPGQTRYSFRSTMSMDDVNKGIPLQRRFGHGTGGTLAGSFDQCIAAQQLDCVATGVNFGPELTEASYRQALANLPTCGGNQACGDALFDAQYPNGIRTFDHWGELFRTGTTYDNTLTISGGNDRTTFFLSAGRLDQKGVIIGPSNWYEKSNVRLKATHRLTDRITIGGNGAYTDTRGAYVQKGSNLGGLLLGGLRTAANWDNRSYIDPVTKLHRAYRYPTPSAGSERVGRVYDNPFFVVNESKANSELGRIIGNVNVDWQALDWLQAKWTLGGDYYGDYRLNGIPLTSSAGLRSASGEVIRADITNLQLDHNLLVTATHGFSPDIATSLTLGHNMNSRRLRQNMVWGVGMIAPTPYTLANTVSWIPLENRQLINTESFFGQATADLYDQLYLTAALRNDGFSTFGESERRHWFPKASAAWTFTTALGNTDQTGLLSYGKLRLAYGETGKEPIPYATIDVLTAGSTTNGWAETLNYTQAGNGGVITARVAGNPDLKPERTREVEFGTDLGFFDQMLDLGVTYYDSRSSDVILSIPVAISTGRWNKLANAAEITNKGLEATLNVRPITRPDLSWDLGFVFGRNRNNVVDLAGAQFVNTTAATQGSFAGAVGSFVEGYQSGVLMGNDFVRCGRGLVLDVDGDNVANNIDAECGGAPEGAVYLGADGLPVQDPTNRVIGDPNPDWTGSVRSSVTFRRKWQLSGLVDIRRGGVVWNGTKGALYNFGTHKDTEARGRTVYMREYLAEQGRYSTFAGPGVDVPYVLDQTFFTGIGGTFNGPSAQGMEDGSFVKLREISLSFMWDDAFVKNQLGLSSVDLRIAGRNLRTWTNYTGIDPETNLGGAEAYETGIDYFNHPQTRSFVFTVGLNR